MVLDSIDSCFLPSFLNSYELWLYQNVRFICLRQQVFSHIGTFSWIETVLSNEDKVSFEKIMYSFIWDSKPDKIKRSTLIQNYEKGGIKMINIEKFIMSLKVTWVKKILDSCNNGVLKKNYLKKLEKYGSDLFFECNFDEKDIRTCLKKISF